MTLSYLEPVCLCEVRFYFVETLGQRRKGIPKDRQEAGRWRAPSGLLQDWMNLLLASVQNWRWQVQVQLLMPPQVPEDDSRMEATQLRAVDVAQLLTAAEDWAGLVAGCKGGLFEGYKGVSAY